ncbi:alpha/beta fold hydrolase [Rhodobacteraceae bacterium]|nr:alpha/beta fold hydrolase [Paracoccaceae bacterium]
MTAYIPHSEVSGKNGLPALLLLNSLGTTTHMWNPQMAILERHFKVIRMDTRGHGQSATPDGDYSFDDLVMDALGTLDRHDVKTASVMGCSLGSMTALGLGLHAPDRIDRIVCTAARADAPKPFRQSWDDRMAVIAEKGIAGLWDGSLGNWLTPAFREADPDTVEAMKTEFHKTTPDGYCGCAAALKGLDYLRHLPNLTVPTLFVAGSEDKGAPPPVMEAMSEAAKNGQFVIVPSAGHIINVNAPEAFSLAIMDFLGMTPA